MVPALVSAGVVHDVLLRPEGPPGVMAQPAVAPEAAQYKVVWLPRDTEAGTAWRAVILGAAGTGVGVVGAGVVRGVITGVAVGLGVGTGVGAGVGVGGTYWLPYTPASQIELPYVWSQRSWPIILK